MYQSLTNQLSQRADEFRRVNVKLEELIDIIAIVIDEICMNEETLSQCLAKDFEDLHSVQEIGRQLKVCFSSSLPVKIK